MPSRSVDSRRGVAWVGRVCAGLGFQRASPPKMVLSTVVPMSMRPTVLRDLNAWPTCETRSTDKMSSCTRACSRTHSPRHSASSSASARSSRVIHDARPRRIPLAFGESEPHFCHRGGCAPPSRASSSSSMITPGPTPTGTAGGCATDCAEHLRSPKIIHDKPRSSNIMQEHPRFSKISGRLACACTAACSPCSSWTIPRSSTALSCSKPHACGAAGVRRRGNCRGKTGWDARAGAAAKHCKATEHCQAGIDKISAPQPARYLPHL
jgi:hypothetical protein